MLILLSVSWHHLLLVDDGVAKLREDLKEKNAERDGEIKRLDEELAMNREQHEALRKELQQLEEKARALKAKKDHLMEEKKHAERVGWFGPV